MTHVSHSNADLFDALIRPIGLRCDRSFCSDEWANVPDDWSQEAWLHVITDAGEPAILAWGNSD